MRRVRRRAATREESGIAMIAAILITIVAMSLSVVAVQSALHSLSSTTVDRNRTQSVETSEAGLNSTYQTLGTVTSSASLPCGPQSSVSLGSTPDISSYAVTINYYDTYPPTDAALTCSQVTSGSVTPVAADVVSVGSAVGYGQRKMEGLVHLTSNGAGSTFDMAIYSNYAMSGSNNMAVYHHLTNDANIYSGQSVTCPDNMVVQGSIYAQGGATISNNCSVGGDVYTVSSTTLGNNAVVSGNVKVSSGNITLDNSAAVGQSAYASGSITLGNHATVGHQQVPNDTGLAPPPVETMPQLNWSSSAWQSAGYTVVTDNNCTNVYTDISNISTASSPIAVETSCALSWPNNTTISLKQNLAIFSTGGFTMNNNDAFNSADGSPHNLYMVVPYNAATMPCTSPGITLNNNSSIDSKLTTLLYTPCTLSVNNNSSEYGQMYAGTINAGNNFTENYVPTGTIPGLTSGAAAYKVGIGFEREVT